MRPDEAAEGALAGTDPANRAQDLASAMRRISIAAADAVGGGVCLIYARSEGGELRLRTAAGFNSPRDAKTAAEVLQVNAEAAVRDNRALAEQGSEALGPKGVGALRIHPLVAGDHTHGALVVGAPGSLDETGEAGVSAAAEAAAWRLDHARIARELDAMHDHGIAGGAGLPSEDKGDEILKLSEALFAQDIELLRSHEKLGKIEKLKNDFIEKMSRELRTPLNSIIEAIISVLAGENEALSESAKQSLRAALDDGTAFLRTLQNILDLWRIKQNELPVEIQEVNFAEVADEAIFSVQDSLGDKPILIEKHLEQPFPKIRTDLAKVNQILFLLLDNAVKFTEQGKIQIIARVADGTLTCDVKDTGIGMCPDDQQFAFDEFYQVDELSSTKYRGAGLGLALVRDLLVLMDGGIALDSDVGCGTTISFHLPVQIIG